jgi:hypothetical protein
VNRLGPREEEGRDDTWARETKADRSSEVSTIVLRKSRFDNLWAQADMVVLTEGGREEPGKPFAGSPASLLAADHESVPAPEDTGLWAQAWGTIGAQTACTVMKTQTNPSGIDGP